MAASRAHFPIAQKKEDNSDELGTQDPDLRFHARSRSLEERQWWDSHRPSSESRRARSRNAHYDQQRINRTPTPKLSFVGTGRPSPPADSPTALEDTPIIHGSHNVVKPQPSKISERDEHDLYSLRKETQYPWLASPLQFSQKPFNSHGTSLASTARAALDPHASDFNVDQLKEGDMTEVVAPDPLQRETLSSGWRREDHLESALSDQSPSKDEAVPAGNRRSEVATIAYTISYLIFFAIFGTLSRLGVQWLTYYPGAPVVISNLWANIGGTTVMGFLLEDQQLFRSGFGSTIPSVTLREEERLSEEAAAAHVKHKKTVPLYIGLTVGYCGCFTSFSTFMRDVFLALSNSLPTPTNQPRSPTADGSTITVTRNGGYSLEAILCVVLLTVSTNVTALYFGAHLAIFSHRLTPALPFRLVRNFLDPLFIVLGFGCWFGAVLMCVWPPDRSNGPAGSPASAGMWRGEALFACVFAPVGCLLRWYASLKFNGKIPAFPLGTFLVNMFGVAVLSMCYSLQHVPLVSAGAQIGGGYLSCQVLQGLEDGFCGSLTTVSTWIVELTSLKRRHAYLYGASSVLVSLALVVLIMGSVTWTAGFREAICA